MRLESQLSRMNCQIFSTGPPLWTFGRQRDDADILGYDERGGHMPPGLIHDHYSMGARRHGSSDFDKMQVHRVGIAERQDKPCALSQGRADRSEDVGRCGSLIMRCRCPNLMDVSRASPTVSVILFF